MGNSASIVFPEPMAAGVTSLPPNWAIALIAVAAGITLLWIVALLILILFELFWRGKSSKEDFRKQPPRVLRVAGSDAIKRDLSQISLGTPPPPIPATLDKRNLKDCSHKIEEFKLLLEEDTVSLCSHDSSINSDFSKEDCAKPVLSESVRADIAAEPGATDVTSTDGSTVQDAPLAGMVLSRPVTVRQLGATIREPGYIESEFRKLPVLNVSSEDLPAGTERKNRYTNVLPTPRTRIELPQIFGHPNSDYINGNSIRGYMGSHGQYIATQAPLESTIEDFWRMILDNNTTTIVMATNFQERGIDKCTRYWPAQGSEEYGSVQVTLLQQTAHGTYNTSTLQVQSAGSEVQLVTHYRLTFWPHQGLPKDSKLVTDFLRNIKMADSPGPAVVHCSSGIGRTAVLLACDIGMQGMLQGEPKIDVLRIVSTLRQDRAGMVQTRDQYRFIHQALYDVANELTS